MIFDAVILAAVILSAVIAALRGFIREVLTIIGVVGGLAAAFFGGPILQPVMRGWLGVKDVAKGEEQQKLFDMVPMTIVADICAYGLIFIVVVIVLTVLSHFMATGVKAIGLGPVDRILGVAFGVARAVLLMALLYLPVYLLVQEQDRDDWFKGSYTRVYIEKTASWIAGYLPKGSEEKIEDTASEASRKADEISQRLEDMDRLKKSADRANQALDAARGTLKDAPPQPKAGGSKAGEDGYRPEQREGLDALIEDSQSPAKDQ